MMVATCSPPSTSQRSQHLPQPQPQSQHGHSHNTQHQTRSHTHTSRQHRPLYCLTTCTRRPSRRSSCCVVPTPDAPAQRDAFSFLPSSYTPNSLLRSQPYFPSRFFANPPGFQCPSHHTAPGRHSSQLKIREAPTWNSMSLH